MSTRPLVWATISTKLPTRWGSATSTGAVRQVPPSLSTVRCVAASSASRMSQAHTEAPSRASTTQIARPIPWAAPVTMATCPSSRPMSALPRDARIEHPVREVHDEVHDDEGEREHQHRPLEQDVVPREDG